MTSPEQGPIHAWLTAFEKAWSTDDENDIAELWTADAVYYASPWSAPWVGRSEIVRQWLEFGESDIDWQFEYEVVTDTPELAVVTTHVVYPPDTKHKFRESSEFRGVWIVRFDGRGRAREYTEYWMTRA